MDSLAFLPATELARAIRAREVGCLELLEHYLGRLERLGGAVNAIVVTDLATARARAVAADRALAEGRAVGPLHGVPMTVKESFQLAGLPTTFGYPAFRGNIARRNALAVDRLLAAGANIFGKTNVPLGLMDGQSVNDIYGRTSNPWDLERTPGGSSGGSAAALAAGLTGLELGSDIASSIRNPAHFCGVLGHKPTWGLCPARGHALDERTAFRDIAVIGPLARSVDDLALVLSLIGRPEDGAELTLPPERRQALGAFRVALLLDDPFAEVDREVQDVLAALGRFLAGAGTEVQLGRHPLDDSAGFYRLFMTLLRAATADGIDDESFGRLQQAAAGGPGVDDTVRMNARGATLSHRDWLRHDGARQALRARFDAFFRDVDLLLCPVLSTAAFPHADGDPAGRTLRVNGREVPFENQLFWAGLAGICYLPATVVPAGRTAAGLPVGVQIIGPSHGDLTCLQFARLLERHHGGFVPPPAFAD